MSELVTLQLARAPHRTTLDPNRYEAMINAAIGRPPLVYHRSAEGAQTVDIFVYPSRRSGNGYLVTGGASAQEGRSRFELACRIPAHADDGAVRRLCSSLWSVAQALVELREPLRTYRLVRPLATDGEELAPDWIVTRQQSVSHAADLDRYATLLRMAAFGVEVLHAQALDDRALADLDDLREADRTRLVLEIVATDDGITRISNRSSEGDRAPRSLAPEYLEW